MWIPAAHSEFWAQPAPKSSRASALGKVSLWAEDCVAGRIQCGSGVAPWRKYGYELSSDNWRGHTPLNWTLSARMMQVNRHGRPLREVDQTTIRVRTIDYHKDRALYLEAPGPGFYLYELRIAGKRSAKLAHYQRYLRVVRKVWNVRLGLNRQRFKPGQTVLSRIDNFGSERASFGDGVGVQRRVGDRWVRARDMPPIFLEMWEAWAPPAETAGCIPFELPADFPSGQYRIVKRVGRADGKSGAWLTAPFEVAGHAPWMEQAEAALFHLYGRRLLERLSGS